MPSRSKVGLLFHHRGDFSDDGRIPGVYHTILGAHIQNRAWEYLNLRPSSLQERTPMSKCGNCGRNCLAVAVY